MFVDPWVNLKVAADRHDSLALDSRRRNGTYERRAEPNRRPSALVRRLARRLLGVLVGMAHQLKMHRVAGEKAHFAHRENDGLSVDLYWEHDLHRDAFRVEVLDRRAERRLILHPPTGKAAVDAFYHPFRTKGCSQWLVSRSSRFRGGRPRRLPPN